MESSERLKNAREIAERGVSAIYPSREAFVTALAGKEKLTFYLGIDPTGPSLHLGNIVPLLKLSAIQKLGHKVVLLIGDFTATIGDPDKMSVRVPLSEKEIKENEKNYKKQAEKFLDFNGKNAAGFLHNSEWLAPLKFSDILNIASRVSVGQILERDMFQQRIKEGRPLYLHEFLYPLMQGYDSVAIAADGEIGGNDQIFNMLVGRHLEKQMIGKEKFVIGMRLLADSSGAKMGKTTGNMSSLADAPETMYGNVMSWSDAIITDAFELLTTVSMEYIDDIKKKIESGANPRDIKMLLAKNIVALCYGEESADNAEKEFVRTFQEKELPENMDEERAGDGELLASVLLRAGKVKSKNDFRRLIEEGAVSVFHEESEMKISEPTFAVDRDIVVKIGKRRFLRVKKSPLL